MPFDPTKAFQLVSDSQSDSGSKSFDPSKPFQLLDSDISDSLGPSKPRLLSLDRAGSTNIPDKASQYTESLKDTSLLSSLSEGGNPIAFSKNLVTAPIDVGMAAAGQLASKAANNLTAPERYLFGDKVVPKLEQGKSVIPDEALPLAKEKGVVPALTRTLQGITTPEAALTIPFSSGRALFAAQAAASIPESYQKLSEAKTSEELKDAAAELGINVAMATAMGKDALREPAKPTLKISESQKAQFEAARPKGAQPQPQPITEKGDPHANPIKSPVEDVRGETSGPVAQVASGESGEIQQPSGTQEVKAPEASVQKVATPEEISKMTGAELASYFQGKEGGLTKEAWRVGQSVKTPEEVEQLQKLQKEASDKNQEAIKSKQPDFSHAAKGQFFREAYEAATGTGSAGFALRQEVPNYKPPFPIESDLPSKQSPAAMAETPPVEATKNAPVAEPIPPEQSISKSTTSKPEEAPASEGVLKLPPKPPNSIPFARQSELKNRPDANLIAIKPSKDGNDWIVKRYNSRKSLESFLKNGGGWKAVIKNQVEKNMVVHPAFEVEKATEVGSKSNPVAENQAGIPPAQREPTQPQNLPVQKYRVGNNPTLHTVVEKLPASPVEILNKEQPVKVRNEKTGEESTVLESDLTPVKTSEPKTKLDLLLDGVEKTGKELTIEVTDANRENLTKIIDAAKKRGFDASTDGRFVLVKNPVKGSITPKPAKQSIPEKLKALGYSDSEIASMDKAGQKALAERGQKKGVISGSSLESWADRVIKEGSKRISTGLDPELLIAHAIKGAAIFERGVRDFTKWSGEMVRQFGEGIKPYLQTIYEESKNIERNPTRYAVEGDEIKMRRSAARATNAPEIPKDVQEKIASDPNSFYNVQSTSKVMDEIAAMSDADLSNVPRDSNIYVAAKLEQAKRLFNQGKKEGGYSVFVELEKEGTRLGQLINQFKLLKGVNATSVADIVNASLKKAGKDPLTKDQSTRLTGLSQESIELNRVLDSAKEDWVKNPTPENAAKADKALDAANKADIEVQKFVGRFQPKSIAGILKTILQGNLLTPISETANIVGNLSFLPFRAATRTGTAAFDVLDNFLTGRKREASVSPVSGSLEAAKGLLSGVKVIPKILAKGTGDVLKGERSVGLRPLRAWINQFAKNPDVPLTGGKLSFKDRVGLALEGTFGVPAEILLRGLGAGDVPFRRAAEHRIIANEAKLSGVPKNQWAMAQKFPDLFFDDKTLAKIQDETAAAIFQRKSPTIQNILKLFSSKGEWADLAASTVAPYKLTPWNIVSEILSYNPLVAATRVAMDAKAGKTLSAKTNASKFIVGSALTAAGYWLYKNGLVAPSMDSKDERNNARMLAGEVLPPNHLNVSGLERKMAGGSPDFQKGDKTVDIFRAGGLAGSFIYMVANIGRDLEKSPSDDSDSMMWSMLKNSTIEQARFAVNQSFLQGVGGLMDAIRSGSSDGYIKSWENSMLSIPLPNTLSAASRATRPNKVEIDGLKDLVKSRLGVFGMDDLMTAKRGLWGEPIPETPEGRNAIIYQFFDVTKGKTSTDDPVASELYRIWRKTADTSVIPNPPLKTLTVNNQTYNLDTPQYSAYAELVGKARRQYVESMILDEDWKTLSTDEKAKFLQRAYQKGLDYGKSQFLDQFGDALIAKPEKRGFDSE